MIISIPRASSCRGMRCSQRDQCFYNPCPESRPAFHVIIVNHSLIFSDMFPTAVFSVLTPALFSMRRQHRESRAPVSRIIFGYYRIRRILNRLLSTQDGAYGLLAVLGDWADEMTKGWPEFAANRAVIDSASELVRYIREVTGDLFASLDAAVRSEVSRSSSSHAGKLRYAPAQMFSGCATTGSMAGTKRSWSSSNESATC